MKLVRFNFFLYNIDVLKLHKIIFLIFLLGFFITVNLAFADVPAVSGEKIIEPSSEKVAILHIEDSPPRPELRSLQATPSIEPSSEPVALDSPSQALDSPHDLCHSLVRPFSIEAGYTSSEGIGYDKGYSTLGIFLSLPEYRYALPFLNAKAHLFDDGKWACNTGAGIRFREDRWNLVWGFNGFYDYRRSLKHNFNQMGFGIDIMGKSLSFRANGYIPTASKQVFRKYTFNRFQENNLILDKNVTLSMWGLDGELEGRVKFNEGFEFIVAAGAYYYKGDFGKDAIGGKGRIFLNIWDYLIGGVKISYDDLFKFNIQGDIRLQIPFGPRSKSLRQQSGDIIRPVSCTADASIMRRMVQPVERQEIIVLSDQKREQTAGDLYSNESLFFYHVNNLYVGPENGTFEAPFSTLAAAQAVSAPNQVIYVDFGSGTSTGQATGFTLQDNQMLLSSGVDHMVRSSQGFVPIPASTPGRLARITNGADAIVLANNNVIEGFELLTVTGNAFIASDRPVASAILNNRIIDSTVAGIRIEYTAAFSGDVAGTWAINGNFITASAGGVEGIEFETTGSGALRTDIDFSRNQIVDNASDGMLFQRTAGGARWVLTGQITNNFVLANGGEGIYFDQVAGAAVAPIFFNLALTDNVITDNAAEGVQIERGAGLIEISRNFIGTNGGTAGLFLEIQAADRLTAIVNDNEFSNNASSDSTHFETESTSILRLDLFRNISAGGDVFTFDVNGASTQFVRMGNNSGPLDVAGVITVLP